MSKFVQLSKVAKYSKKRIEAEKVSLENFVTIDNILQNKVGITTATNLPPSSNATPAYEAGHILVGNIRPYLKKIWYANRDGGCSADVLNFEVNKGYDSKFVYYSLFRDDFFTHMMKGVKGTKMPRGDKNQIMEFLIPNFDLSTQQKIADVLSALDAKIELNARVNAELESLAKTIYDYWFVQFKYPTSLSAPLSLSGHPPKWDMEALQNSQNSPVPFGGTEGGGLVWNEELKRKIPLGWEVGTLLDIADYMNGLPCQKFRPTGKEFLRVIKIREMRDGFTQDSELVRPDIPEKAIIENGDVLFSWSASLEVMIWANGKGALNQHIFKVTSEKYPRSFYYFQLLNYLQHFKMMAENRKTTMGHITQDHLRQSRIVLPPKELTEKLENIISPIFEKILVNKQESQALTELRDWLLPLLMNGQVKV